VWVGIVIDEVLSKVEADIRRREVIVLGPPRIDVADDAPSAEPAAAVWWRKCPGLRQPHRA
jgi:hypothetical protein